MIALLLPVAVAQAQELHRAQEVHLVREGEDLVSITSALGLSPELREGLRTLNGLAPGEEPVPGTLLQLPERLESIEHHDALVLSLRGEAWVQLGRGRRSPLRTGDSVTVGSTLCTGPAGTLNLRLAVAPSEDGHSHDEIVLFHDTCLTVDAAHSTLGARSSVVSMASGSLSVRKVDDAEGLLAVQVGEAVSAASAGGFRVTVEQDEVARTEATEGDAVVFGAGVEQALAQGYGVRVAQGEAPGEPVLLLEGGDLLAPSAGRVLWEASFSWVSVEAAWGYRVELATDDAFTDVLNAVEVPNPEWVPDLLFLPTRIDALYWRVTPVDRVGFVGVASPPIALDLPPGVGL